MNDRAGFIALEPGARTFCCVATSAVPAAGTGGGGSGSGVWAAAAGAGGGGGAGASSLPGGASLAGEVSAGGGGVSGGGVTIGCCCNQRKQNRGENMRPLLAGAA